MEIFVTYLLSLPNTVLYAIAGGISAAIGVWLSRALGIKKFPNILAIVCFVGATQLLNSFLPELRNSMASDQILGNLKKHRLFSSIFRLHPEAEEEYTRQIRAIMDTAPNGDVFRRSQEASSRIVNQYYNKYLESAPDSVVYRTLQHNLETLGKLQNRPEVCVKYYIGEGITEGELPAEIVAAELELKADVIESAINNPTAAPINNLEDLLGLLASAYEKKGYDAASFGKLDRVGDLSPKEGCAIALEFSDVIVSLGPIKSTSVIKQLLQLSAKQ